MVWTRKKSRKSYMYLFWREIANICTRRKKNPVIRYMNEANAYGFFVKQVFKQYTCTRTNLIDLYKPIHAKYDKTNENTIVLHRMKKYL